MVQRVSTVAFEGIEVRPSMSRCRSPRAAGLHHSRPARQGGRRIARTGALGTDRSGLALPARRITVNLAPADVPKEGSHFDLPIALGLMAAIGAMPPDELPAYTALGELALDGSIAAVAGVLPAASAPTRAGGIICPAACGAGSGLGRAPRSRSSPLLAHAARQPFQRHPGAVAAAAEVLDAAGPPLDLADIKGQESAKRALEVAAAGGHNLLMVGPPGAGKSMLAARLPSILPPLAPAESLEVSMIAFGRRRVRRRRVDRPPAVSRAASFRLHAGPCRRRHARAAGRDLARPSRRVVSRRIAGIPAAALEVAAPAARNRPGRDRPRQPPRHLSGALQLVAAMNPCRCGHADDPGYACGRGRKRAAPRITRRAFPARCSTASTCTSRCRRCPPPISSCRRRPRAARGCRARRRRARAPGCALRGDRAAAIRTNAAADRPVLEEVARPDAGGRALLREAADAMRLSARGFHRVLRVARTLADLDGADKSAACISPRRCPTAH